MIKKSLFILTILFLLQIISAVEFDMKTQFDQGETLLAKISGNFLKPILKDNVFFYRGHVRIPMDYDVTKINDEFYIYALLSDKTENNYSIVIKDVKYMKGAEISEEEISKDFSITTNTADFSVNPGFIVTKEDFFIEVQNLQDKKINITIKDEDISITLKSGEIKKINFELNDLEKSVFKTVELSSENLKYEIPFYLFSDKEEPVKEEKMFKFEPSELEISMSTDSEAKRIIYLYNTGEETLENLSIFVSDSLIPYVLFSLEEFEELEPDSNVKLELYFYSDSEEKIIEGKMTVNQENLYAYSYITLNFIKDYIPLENESEPVATTQTCEEMGGVICTKEQNCSQELIYAKDDICCLGSCEEIEPSSTGKIVGWTIIGVVIIFLIWFFKRKYRGAKRGVDLFKIAKGKR